MVPTREPPPLLSHLPPADVLIILVYFSILLTFFHPVCSICACGGARVCVSIELPFWYLSFLWKHSSAIKPDILTLFSSAASFVFCPLPASLRSELNHIHASAIEHLRQTHHQESAAAKMELEKTLENSRTQVGHGNKHAQLNVLCCYGSRSGWRDDLSRRDRGQNSLGSFIVVSFHFVFSFCERNKSILCQSKMDKG